MKNRQIPASITWMLRSAPGDSVTDISTVNKTSTRMSRPRLVVSMATTPRRPSFCSRRMYRPRSPAARRSRLDIFP